MEPHLGEAPADAAVKPRRRWWRWLLTGMLVIAIGGWFGRFWLGELFAETLRGELAARGFHVSWKSVVFSPPAGLSFKGFQVFRDAARSDSLITWDQVAISRSRSNWAGLRLHAEGSELVLGAGADSLRVTDLTMDLDADREGVTVEKLSGLAHGLRVEVTGSVLFSKLDALREKRPNPQAAPTPAGSPATPANKGLEGTDLAFLSTVGEWMRTRQLGDREVHLAVSIREREAAPGYLLRADLDGSDCEWRGQHFPSLGITMEWPLTGRTEPIMVTRLLTSPEENGQKLRLVVDLIEHEVRVKAESATLHLGPVLSAAVPALAGILKPFDTGKMTHLRMTGVIPWKGDKSTQLDGEVVMTGPLALKPAEGKLIEVTKLQTTFALTGQKLVLRKLSAGLWGGRMQLAEAQVDLKGRTWEVKGAQMQGLQMPLVNLSLGWKNGFSGVVGASWDGAGGSSLASMRVAGALQAADAVFPFPSLGGLRQGDAGKLEFQSLQSRFSFDDQTLQLQAMTGDIWSGRLQLTEARMDFKKSTWQVAGAEILKVSIPEMRRGLELPDRKQKGALHGSWQGGGGLKLTSLTGQGSLRITEEGFDRLPVLGPMSLVFVTLAPGFSEETLSRMATDYTLRGGILRVSRLRVDSATTEIQAEGDLNLVTQHAKLTARAKLRGIAGLPTGLLGRLLTLDGEGPFAEIQWRLRYAFGLEQVAGVAAVAGDTVLDAGRIGAGIAAGTVGGVEKAAKGILRIPFRPRTKEEKK